MTKVQEIEREVQSLTAAELAAFREWFEEFDAEAWDRQLERDVRAGKLDDMVRVALQDEASGKCTEL